MRFLTRSGLVPLLAFGGAAAAGVVAPREATADPTAAATDIVRPWITIDAIGQVATVTPTVVDGGRSTESAAPSELTRATAFVLLVDGRATTTRAAPPVATATGPGAAGAFLACDGSAHYAAADVAPFCQPRGGSQLVVNQTYYITWDPTFFGSDPEQAVEVEMQNTATGEGLLSGSLDAHAGFYAWAIDGSLAHLQDGDADDDVNVTFYLAYNLTADGSLTRTRARGPSVIVTSHPRTVARHRVPVGAVVGAIVVGVLVLGLVCYCVWAYRHEGRLPCIGRLVSKRTSSFSAKGYGVRQSYGQRTGSGAFAPRADGIGGGSDHHDAAAWPASSPRTGNAFREELKRQEEERQRM